MADEMYGVTLVYILLRTFGLATFWASMYSG